MMFPSQCTTPTETLLMHCTMTKCLTLVLHFFFSFFYISLLGYAVRHDVICQGNSSVGNLGGMNGMRGCLAGGLGSRSFLELVGWLGFWLLDGWVSAVYASTGIHLLVQVS